MNKEDLIKKELINTINNTQYNGWNNRTTYGYHSYNLEEIDILGQRNPKKRLEEFKKKIDFKNKNVLDFGCNVGSMLHHLFEIKQGIGFDYDEKCIASANNISKILERENLNFNQHDFDKNTYPELKQKINIKPDVIFILSLGSWVKSWKDLYELCCDYDCDIVLELNNIEEGKSQIDFFKEKGRNLELIMDNSKDDSTGNNLRKTYLIKK